MSDLPQFSDVEDAAERLRGTIYRTPLVQSHILNEKLGANIFFKAECLQKTGSFKFRGAYNAVSRMGEVAKEKGVLACSSGNHAQGIAEAARLMGVNATIIMPKDAPELKKQRTLRSGAKIVEYDRHSEDREVLTKQLAEQTGMPVVHPYESFHVIAGQGTVGLEACEELQTLGLVPDHVLVCAGGGGLMAGIKLAVHQYFPQAIVHPVEPEGYDDQKRSHAMSERISGNANQPNVCDAILTPMPGEASFEICKGQLGEGLVVSEAEALNAVAFAFNELKLVVEPGGAVTLAALLAEKLDVADKCIIATLSGGNIDPHILEQALSQKN